MRSFWSGGRRLGRPMRRIRWRRATCRRHRPTAGRCAGWRRCTDTNRHFLRPCFRAIALARAERVASGTSVVSGTIISVRMPRARALRAIRSVIMRVQAYSRRVRSGEHLPGVSAPWPLSRMRMKSCLFIVGVFYGFGVFFSSGSRCGFFAGAEGAGGGGLAVRAVEQVAAFFGEFFF